MARRVIAPEEKIARYDNEIEMIKNRIQKLKDDLTSVEEEKRNYLNKIREEEVGELYEKIQSSGLTVEAVLEMLDKREGYL